MMMRTQFYEGNSINLSCFLCQNLKKCLLVCLTLSFDTVFWHCLLTPSFDTVFWHCLLTLSFDTLEFSATYVAKRFVSRLIKTKFTATRLYSIIRCPQDVLTWEFSAGLHLLNLSLRSPSGSRGVARHKVTTSLLVKKKRNYVQWNPSILDTNSLSVPYSEVSTTQKLLVCFQ